MRLQVEPGSSSIELSVTEAIIGSRESSKSNNCEFEKKEKSRKRYRISTQNGNYNC